MSLELMARGVSDQGRKRQNNEDAFLVEDALGLYIVCDGVGGSRGGEVASSMACQLVRNAVAAARAELQAPVTQATAHARLNAMALLERAVQQACGEIHARGRADRNIRGMSTTIDVLVRIGNKAVIAHVGDSRVYLVRGGQVFRLTEDHTLAAAQVKAGVLTPEQAREGSGGNVLTRTVGGQRSVQVDTLLVDLMPDDVLILCSDGLHRYLDTDAELARHVQGLPPETVAGTLVHYANQRGGEDNVTVVALRCRSSVDDADARAAMARMDALRATPLMRHLDYREQVGVMAIAESRRYAAGQIIVREGEASLDLYVVVQGRVTVQKSGVRIAELTAGGQFGEMALVDHAPRSATVVASEPADVLVIGHSAMMGLMRMDPVLGVKILWSLVQGLSAKLRTASTDLIDVQRGGGTGPGPAPTQRLPFA